MNNIFIVSDSKNIYNYFDNWNDAFRKGLLITNNRIKNIPARLPNNEKELQYVLKNNMLTFKNGVFAQWRDFKNTITVKKLNKYGDGDDIEDVEKDKEKVKKRNKKYYNEESDEEEEVENEEEEDENEEEDGNSEEEKQDDEEDTDEEEQNKKDIVYNEDDVDDNDDEEDEDGEEDDE